MSGTSNLSDVSIVGITTIQNTTDSSSTDSGSLVVVGGVGIAKHLSVGNGIDVYGTSTLHGNLFIDGNLSYTGNVFQNDVSLSIYFSEQVDISNNGTGPGLIVRQFGHNPIAQFYDDITLVLSIEDGGDISMNHDLYVNGTTPSTSTDTGSLRVKGVLV